MRPTGLPGRFSCLAFSRDSSLQASEPPQSHYNRIGPVQVEVTAPYCMQAGHRTRPFDRGTRARYGASGMLCAAVPGPDDYQRFAGTPGDGYPSPLAWKRRWSSSKCAQGLKVWVWGRRPFSINTVSWWYHDIDGKSVTAPYYSIHYTVLLIIILKYLP